MLQTMPRSTVKAPPPPPEALRFRKLREDANISRDKLASKAGIHRNTIQKYETGERKLTLKIIDRLAPLLGKTRDDVISTDGIDRGETVSIPECNVRVAQNGAFEMDEATRKDVWILPRRYLMDELRVPPGRLIIHEVHSDAMAPTLLAGDRVLVNLDDQKINHPGVFLIADAQGDVLKRLETVPGSKPLMVKLMSDNPRHGAYEVRASDTKVIGRVVWYARRM
jgi:transcriptional regulator with XRE-family HTH domain